MRPASLGFIGICVDDVTSAVLVGNDVSGYIIGLCIQTHRAEVRNNAAHDNCIGVFVDPGIDALVHGNHISTNNAPCADFFFTGIGIFIQGAVGTQLRNNRIDGHAPGDFGAGPLLIDDDAPGPLASDNVVKHNVFTNNTRDIQFFSAGTGDVIAHNDCNTSDPAELCG